ncbi:hypothetical protein [Acinetobacter guillouiae]|uniref:hypothetical protein n=1 Tax=Acinetobacter guillouiae TaxID=106649 RepID=UPI003AF7382D
MNEPELYAFAHDILTTITRDLNEEVYSDLGGKLTLTWSTKPIFQATASSSSSIDSPPIHTICIYYELVKQLYTDILRFEHFANNIEIQKDIKKILDEIIEIPPFPQSIDKKDAIINMFISCLTWIYFHELGHLYQEHGFIRKKFGLVDISEQTLEEQYVINSDNLTFQQSKISHITEIAADHFGSTMCSFELLRHFSSIHETDLINPDSKGEEFIESTYMFLIGISSTLYRFYGEKILRDNNLLLVDDIPKGSHPNPIVRLELIYRHIIELMSLTGFKSIANYQMSKEELVRIFTRAIYTGAFVWIILNVNPDDFTFNYFSSGILNSEEKMNYMKIMVQAWKEIEPTILDIERHSIPFGTLTFSSQFIQLLDSAASFKTP